MKRTIQRSRNDSIGLEMTVYEVRMQYATRKLIVSLVEGISQSSPGAVGDFQPACWHDLEHSISVHSSLVGPLQVHDWLNNYFNLLDLLRAMVERLPVSRCSTQFDGHSAVVIPSARLQMFWIFKEFRLARRTSQHAQIFGASQPPGAYDAGTRMLSTSGIDHKPLPEINDADLWNFIKTGLTVYCDWSSTLHNRQI